MAEVKVTTTMVIKVDLDCEKCHKKIKKVLCQISQIQNQVYDKKANTVTITVVCCSPEKIKKKICCKGGEAIKGIEIKVPEKPKAPEKPKEPEKPKAPEKPKEPEKPKAPEKPKQPEKSKEPEKPKEPAPKPKEPEKKVQFVVDPPPKPKAPEPAPKPAPPLACPNPEPVQMFPAMGMGFPSRDCCRECYQGFGWGPCYSDHGRAAPAPAPPCYGLPVYDSWGGGGGCPCQRSGYYVCRCEFVRDDSQSTCGIM